MRAVLQRVTKASTQPDRQTVGEIGAGLFVLLGVETGDNETDARYIAQKIAGLRIFEDEEEDEPLRPTDRRQRAGDFSIYPFGRCQKGPEAAVHPRRSAGARG